MGMRLSTTAPFNEAWMIHSAHAQSQLLLPEPPFFCSVRVPVIRHLLSVMWTGDKFWFGEDSFNVTSAHCFVPQQFMEYLWSSKVTVLPQAGSPVSPWSPSLFIQISKLKHEVRLLDEQSEEKNQKVEFKHLWVFFFKPLYYVNHAGSELVKRNRI